ncbi:MAG: succinate dehydrogenase, cytochrome b556 subunit [Verrucomicrobiaceae bacterium]|nr:succinate dehydrogenase, cytochrome b556 subunit [Verrucomicrobiaceae bacterium]
MRGDFSALLRVFLCVALPKFSHFTVRVSLPCNCLPISSMRKTAGHNQCDESVNKQRPVNLDIGTISLPITAYASLLHRISGVALFIGVAILMWLLDSSLSSEDGFNAVKALFDSFLCKLIVWGVLAVLIYHTVAGIRHLTMDLGIGETMEGGSRSARIVFVVSVILIVLVGARIW